MTTIASSKLNPLASTFVPTFSVSSDAGLIRDVALKLIQELVQSKKSRGDNSFTKLELVKLVEKLIAVRYNLRGEIASIRKYLYEKLLHSKCLPDYKLDCPNILGQPIKPFTLDESAIPPPKSSFLLVAFFGLYRHEQPMRPLLSLSYRPEALMDKVWSFCPDDKKLWNPSCVKSACECPPMFGYIVPPGFFSNPLKVPYACPIKTVHVNHYSETLEGNEACLLKNSWNDDFDLELEPFSDDFERKIKVEVNLEFYSEQLKSIVAGVCGLIKAGEADNVPRTCTEDHVEDCNYLDSLWDENPDASETKLFNEVIEDDDCHPLLNRELNPEEGVMQEIEEMIRKGLTTRSNPKTGSNLLKHKLDEICDPPCSVWCGSQSEETSGLVRNCVPGNVDGSKTNQLFAQLKETDVEIKTLQSEAFEYDANIYEKSQRPGFRRSFSVNDCEPYLNERLDSSPKPLATSREMLHFLRKDPINFFKTFNRSDSWKDSDSGFVSHSSSEDVSDVASDSEPIAPGKTSLWGPFGGDGNLWKPLPDCTTNEFKQRSCAHKRVRDLRRQTSLN